MTHQHAPLPDLADDSARLLVLLVTQSLGRAHPVHNSVGHSSPAMGARNQVGIGLYRPASLCRLSTKFQTRFLESIPRPIEGLKFPTLNSVKFFFISVHHRHRHTNTLDNYFAM
jgi:hypothetical protein